MSAYKRLTSGNFNGAQCDYYDYYIDGCRIGNSILKCKECPRKECYDRLKELEDKLENGLLIELPCRVGDTIYEIAWHYKWVGFGRVLVPDIIESIFDLDILGSYKTMWFLTKEEAEARLKELQEEN